MAADRTGRYHLNHQALSYDAGTGQLNARVTIKEDVMLDPSGNSFAGSFTLDVYDPSGKTQVAHQTRAGLRPARSSQLKGAGAASFD